ncbi:aspartate-semialdehyde dehydrogenase [Candidatus Vidania fulgoroideae]|uniref:Aspartate-semialdehyde dehydrogenase n=1 Tax=Candidatus Vidania fulgoroideorum TaxID=881286 RepID=A0A974X795_9PROT|nr:aspartate-semialdehyde dehydrogenase [Candidatus Vidania fulgoroideae]
MKATFKVAIMGTRGLVGNIVYKKLKSQKNNYNIITIKTTHQLTQLTPKTPVIFCKEKQEALTTFKILKQHQWNGYWIDASSCFRQCKKALIVLDPINKKEILKHIKTNKILCGGNCTVNILLLAIAKLIKKNSISQITCVTFQAISGLGYKKATEILETTKNLLKNPLAKLITHKLKNKFKNTLSLEPWIGENMHTPEEETKTKQETNKIIKPLHHKQIKIHSTCVRVNVIRCHTLAITLTLTQATTKHTLITTLKNHKIVKIIPNNKQATQTYLNPNTVAGTKKIYIGRIRKLNPYTYSMIIIGDQLIWGASEPLIRTLKIIRKYENKNMRHKNN